MLLAHPPLNIFSTSHTSEHAYVNGREIKNVELTKTQKNQWMKVTGHINGRPVYYQNYPPLRWKMSGMTTLQSRRKRRKNRSKTEKKPKSDTSFSKRK